MSNDMQLLRMFHNNIKFWLLKTYANKCFSLLDIGSGRGGDIFKWDKCNIIHVIGVDINKEYIDEARNRLNNANFKFRRNYSFLLIPTNFPNLIDLIEKKFYTISCQFAFHYFWKNEDILNNICFDIGNLLMINGFFIGTVLNGDLIHDMLQHNNKFENESIMIEGFFDPHKKKIGNRIHFYMTGTLYFGEKTVSTEYLVYKDIFVHHMQKNGLELVAWESFSTLYENTKLFNKQLSDISKYNSFLYNYFVFKKIT